MFSDEFNISCWLLFIPQHQTPDRSSITQVPLSPATTSNTFIDDGIIETLTGTRLLVVVPSPS